MLCQTEELLELANKEKDILFRFEHVNILRAIDSEMRQRPDKGPDMLRKERMEKGEGALSTFTEEEVWIIFSGICQQSFKWAGGTRQGTSQRVFFLDQPSGQGVAQFHTANLALRDLKPANVLMFKRTLPKLSDFGSVGPANLNPAERKEALQLQQLFESTTTVMFRAPECFEIKADSQLTAVIDVWALGCILFALMFNHSPFEEAYKTGNVGLAAMSGNYRMPDTDKYSELLRQTVGRLLSVDPAFRPSIAEVIDMIPGPEKHL